MSDRIGVMRDGQAGAGRHAERDLLGAADQVRLRVHRRRERHPRRRARATARCSRRRCKRSSARRPARHEVQSGHLVIRPEFVRFLGKPDEADNASRAGSTTNMRSARASSTRCASASRSSWSRSSASRLSGKLDDQVLIGWDAAALHSGDRRVMAAGDRHLREGRAAAGRSAAHRCSLSASPRRCSRSSVFSFMPPRTFGLLQQPTLENYVTIFTGTSYISFLWSLGARGRDRRSCWRSSAIRSPTGSSASSAAGRRC